MDDSRTTLGEARKELRKGWEVGTTCPCCGQHAQLYRRKLNSGMARMLIRLYRLDRANPGGAFHVREIIGSSDGGSGDLSKMVYWNLIVGLPKDPAKDTRTSGEWMITPLGRQFAEGDRTVRSHVIVYNGRERGFEGDMIDIRVALGAKFSYTELMGRVPR
jgi:hypothetical protein